ncbi:uncharacterized protein [Rutidosis leptorrhynchoides]|uniref:uncharacterized protein n=1 Tax=Rutidosis leptorrhynchoides TaxID=125765 RepID=UPI003A99E373
MLTIEKLYAYHTIDREVFTRLLIILSRSVAESVLIMSTWMWLEDKDYSNIIFKLFHASNLILNDVADEAVFILNCLQFDSDTSIFLGKDGVLPLTSTLTQKSVTLQMISQKRFTTIIGIKSFLNNVCSRIFTDILQDHVLSCSHQFVPNRPILQFSHPTFGSFRAINKSLGFYDHASDGIWSWNPTSDVSEDDRTMFLTFSRGFPVSDDEVRSLFTQTFGECVERVDMQENINPNEQPLFAKLLLLSITTVDEILKGRRDAKFRVNGKHIWARKYERRGNH